MARWTPDALLWRLLFGVAGRILPIRLCRFLARPLAGIAWRLGLRRAITMSNLRLAFPSLTHGEQSAIGRQSLVNLFTVFLEFITLRHLRDDELQKQLHVENPELLRGIGPNGALLLSGHFGNWELLALGAAAISGVQFSIVVKAQNDYGELDRMRTSRGNHLIPQDQSARQTTAILRDGGVVAMLADQAASDRDHLVLMFGIPTYSFAAPARVALRFRPTIIVGFAVRQQDGSYRVRLEELPHNDLEDTPEGALALTQRYATSLEQIVMKHPEQWLWQHRKWKNSPGVRYE